MAASTVPAAIKTIIDALGAVDPSAWGDRVPDVSLGFTDDSGREAITLGVAEGDEEFVALGNRKRDEDFTVDLFVIVRFPGHTAVEAMERAWGLWDVVDDVLNAPAFAPDAGAMWCEMKRPRGVPTVEGTEGHGYVVQSAVRFRSRRRPT